jgi:chromosome segregation ATPase/pSer/pThr/pTyr-binding forkhead associated (FHA) protein
MLTLLYSDVDGHERSHEVGSEPVMVGRSSECAIRSDDARVSRHHARFYFEQGALWVEDLGSANGVYLGPNKVQRAIVPAAEIIVVGSLVLRLLPSNGTMPPPIGVHGTLAQWLTIERKARAHLEEERNAFAQRVGEMHRQMSQRNDAEALRQRSEALAQALAERDEAIARIQTLEGELADNAQWSSAIEGEQTKMMEEMARMRRESSGFVQSRTATERSITVEHDDSDRLRQDYEAGALQNAAEVEQLRAELAEVQDRLAFADTRAGVVLAERMAEADQALRKLHEQLAEARSGTALELARSQAGHTTAELVEKLAAMTKRADAAEKDLAAALVRGQGAERTQTQAQSAERRAGELEMRALQAEAKVSAFEAKIKSLEAEHGRSRRPSAIRIEGKAAELEVQLAESASALQALQARVAELEQALAHNRDSASAAETRAAASGQTMETLQAQLAESENKRTAAESALRSAERAVAEVEKATKAKESAEAAVAAANQRVEVAERRAAEAAAATDKHDQRASAADTIAKAMAKDVAEALRRASESDVRAKSAVKDQAQLRKTIDELKAALAERENLAGVAEKKSSEVTSQVAAIEAQLVTERAANAELVKLRSKLEGDLGESRGVIRDAEIRANRAEALLAERDAQSVTATESHASTLAKMTTERTTTESSLLEARHRIRELESQAAQADPQVEQLHSELGQRQAELDRMAQQHQSAQARVLELEQRLRDREQSLAEAESAAGVIESAKVSEAVSRAEDAERKAEQLSAKAEVADLAVGRASGLQRQLDDALTKLAWIERDFAATKANRSQDDALLAEREAFTAERDELTERLHAATSKLAEQSLRLERADRAASERQGLYERAQQDLSMQEHELSQLRSAQAAREQAERERTLLVAQLATVEQTRAQAEREHHQLQEEVSKLRSDNVEAERDRARLQGELSILQAEAAEAGQLQERALGMQTNIEQERAQASQTQAQLQSELDRIGAQGAEAARAQERLEQELRTMRNELERAIADRHQLHRELRIARGDTDEVQLRAAGFEDREVTSDGEVNRFRAAQVENEELRRRVHELEDRMRAPTASEAMDDGPPPRPAIPEALAEHLNVLEESIDSLRANMRAASDETAVMEDSESVIVVSNAVSQAAEHVERARAALRALVAYVET